MRLTPEDCIGEQSPGRLLRYVNQLVRLRLEQNLSNRHSSCQNWLSLKLLEEGTVKNPGDLARALGVATGHVTRIVDSLEDKGWIERDRSAYDRREILLRLTPDGVNELQRLTTILVASWNDVFSAFSESDFSELVRLLTLMKQGLQMQQSWLLEAAQ
jgi:DNA-binding MarR family transcriptional regulator